jgi:outer membrane receptor for ferrienterochelin and colicins
MILKIRPSQPSGVVNIITRRPSTDRWEGTVALDSTFQSDSDFGGYTTLEGYASGPLVNERLALQVYGRLFDRAASRIDIRG